MRRFLVVLVAAALALGVVPAPAVAADGVITSVALTFVPPQVTVQQGDGLVYYNADAFDHDVVSVQTGDDGQPLFASPVIGTGENARVDGVEALESGAYDFICRLHSNMEGTLTVQEPGGSGLPTLPEVPEIPGVPGLAAPQVALAPVPGVFSMPVAMAQHPASDDLYIVEKTGTIRAVRGGVQLDPTPVLDVSSEVSGGLEQGLLGLAFSHDGEYLYVNMTDTAGDTHVLEYAFADGYAVTESRREVLSIDQPFANHNGGSLLFGPDGYLYLGFGDGGDAGDPGYRAQRLDTRLGKLLRIDPRPAGEAAFTAPIDNPFVGDPGALPEIWAYGLRNPWKFSFDRATGDLWIADVGQGVWEEVNLQRGGATGGDNYGWNHMEGLELYSGRPSGAQEPADHHPPIHVYEHDGVACSITGGYVYRGATPSLQGAYLFSDWCDGELRYLREVDGEVVESGPLGVTVPSITAFGEDHAGELYALSLAGTVFKIVPLPTG